MPIYAYRCPACGLEFEVSRRLADRAKPAACPHDGTEGKRLMTAPNLGGVAADPATQAASPAPAAQSWSHFGHTHTGSGGHSHDAPAPPAPPSA